MLLDLGLRLGVDHVPVVLGQLVVQVLGRMGEQVAVLMNRAALDRQLLAPQGHERGFQDRGAVHDDELGPRHTSGVRH